MSTLEDIFYLSSMTKVTQEHNPDEVKEVIEVASQSLGEAESATVYLGAYDPYDCDLTRLRKETQGSEYTVVTIVLEIPNYVKKKDLTNNTVNYHLSQLADRVIKSDEERKHAADVAEAERDLAAAYAQLEAARNRVESLNS